MSESPIASPVALALAADNNYGVRHLDSGYFPVSTRGSLRGSPLACTAEAFAVDVDVNEA